MPAPLPNFLVIGAQKSATRWLRLNLGEHPDIHAADRVVHFFNRHYDRGLDWYRRQFAGWDGEAFVGEASPSYMLWQNDPDLIARRIEESLPDVKLLAILRNPIDRAYSGFIHHMWRGRIPRDTDLVEYVRSVPPEQEPFQLIAGGWYGASLGPYFERFGDRLLVLLQEDAKSEPVAVFEAALRHVGTAPAFRPSELARVRFSRRPPKESGYAHAGEGRRPLASGERVSLAEFFIDDVIRLERLLGRRPEPWRPDFD